MPRNLKAGGVKPSRDCGTELGTYLACLFESEEKVWFTSDQGSDNSGMVRFMN
jgi:hypothetical protein